MKIGKATEAANIQIIHESPIKKNATEIIQNLKSAQSEKQGENLDESQIDRLEQQLMALIDE